MLKNRGGKPAWLSRRELVTLAIVTLLAIPWSAKAADGAWIDATNAAVSWMDSSKWQGQVIAFGTDDIADFGNGLNHTVATTVDLPIDVTIGQILYRDSGSVDRDITFSSSNGCHLILEVTSGAPLVWAKDRSIFLAASIRGSHGLNLQSDDSGGRGVVLQARNDYTGTTTILESAGTTTVVFPGDFGDSDVLVRGTLADPGVELVLKHSRALRPVASLTVENGATVQLAFANLLSGLADGTDLYLSHMTLGGTNLPPGIYSAATHPQFFSGPGEIVVGPARTAFPLTIRSLGPEMAQLSWPSSWGAIYDISATTNLASGAWSLTTVTSTPPTNVLGLNAAVKPAAFYKVAERMESPATVRAGVLARLDQLITSFYLTDQNTNPADVRFGQFHSSDNMRMQECTPVPVWAYLQPDSEVYHSLAALNCAIWSIDYMVRAQGSNGGFNETQGWCGVPNRKTASSSVTGFTLYGIASAIRLLAPLPEMQVRFSEKIDANGSGTNDTFRLSAWKNLLVAAMPYQFSGYGRGHAPNQDLCALAAVFAMNEAYAELTGGAVLKTHAEVATLETEIFYGRPAAAAGSPNGRWFSDSGLLGEPGHGFYGYDANYGAGVSMEFLGALADRDPGAASFLATYASALQYFYVPDPGAYLGVYAENSVARRSTGSPMNVGMLAFGRTHLYHPAMERLYHLAMPIFAADPADNMQFPSPHNFQIEVWLYCEWLDWLTPSEDVGYRLPAEQPDAVEFRDATFKTLVTKPAGGLPTFYVEFWDATNQARRHVWGQIPEMIHSLGLFP